MTYGTKGSPTSFALEDAVAELEGGFRSIPFPSGLAAVAGALMAFLKAGDHLLMTDSVYFPTREFCDSILKRFGVETSYYIAIPSIDMPRRRASATDQMRRGPGVSSNFFIAL